MIYQYLQHVAPIHLIALVLFHYRKMDLALYPLQKNKLFLCIHQYENLENIPPIDAQRLASAIVMASESVVPSVSGAKIDIGRCCCASLSSFVFAIDLDFIRSGGFGGGGFEDGGHRGRRRWLGLCLAWARGLGGRGGFGLRGARHRRG